MKITKRRERRAWVLFERVFDYEAAPGTGFAFTCDEHGAVDSSKVPESYAACLSGTVGGKRVLDRGVRRHEGHTVEPAEGRCNGCARTVVLAGFTNTCACGLDYNMSGQELAPREQWGEETGEHWSECLGSMGDDYIEEI